MVINPDTAFIVDILVKKINEKAPIDTISGAVDGLFTIASRNTYYITPKTLVEIGGIKYKVDSVVINESIKVRKRNTSDPDPQGVEVVIGNPFYLHGTIISAKNELDEITDWGLKYPMIYLHEVYKERFVVDKTKKVAYKPRLRLFFMSQTDPKNYTNADQYDNIIRPMRSLVFSFLKILEKSGGIVAKLESDYDLIPYVNFGKFQPEKGMVKKLFSDDLSGYELSIEVPIKRSYLENLECENSFCCT